MTRTGELHITKECSAYTGKAGDFCTIVSSNIDEIGAGSKVVYAGSVDAGTLDCDISLGSGSGNAAAGHVTLDLGTGTGRISFSGGTGAFEGFVANADVHADSAGIWHWDGTYTFSPAAEAVAT